MKNKLLIGFDNEVHEALYPKYKILNKNFKSKIYEEWDSAMNDIDQKIEEIAPKYLKDISLEELTNICSFAKSHDENEKYMINKAMAEDNWVSLHAFISHRVYEYCVSYKNHLKEQNLEK